MSDLATAGSAAPRPRLALVLAGVLLIAVAAWQTGAWLPEFVDWVEGLGLYGPVIFVVVYALAVLAWVPGWWLTFAGGVLFDVLPATAYVFVGATLGSSLAFGCARYLARRPVERWLAGYERLDRMDRALSQHGLKIVFLLRLSPVFPYTPMNFLLGLTRVRFRDYLLASPGMLPGSLMYVYSGKLAGDMAHVVAGVPPERGPLGWALLALGLVATVALTLLVTRIARRALAADLTGES